MPLCPSIIAELAPGSCLAVDIYCERTSPALNAELANALSNVSFPAAALAAWLLLRRTPLAAAANLIRALIFVAVLIGLGSALFHTVATRWAAWADVVPILVFIMLYLWIVLARYFRWPAWLAAVSLAAFLVVTLFAEAIVPLRGGAMYLPALMAMLATATALYRRQRATAVAMFGAVAVFAVSFAARTADLPLCTSFPLGTHFVWHLLNGLLLYLLMRIAIMQAQASGPASTITREPTGTRR